MNNTPLLDKMLSLIDKYQEAYPEKEMRVHLHKGNLFEITIHDIPTDEYDSYFCRSVGDVFVEIEYLSSV